LNTHTEPLPEHLKETPRLGEEISVTGKWIPSKSRWIFGKSASEKAMLNNLEKINEAAGADSGVLSTEINHAVGGGSALLHQVFANADALVSFYSTTVKQHISTLLQVARPDMHMVRGLSVPQEVRDAVITSNIPAVFGEHLFGYVKNDYARPDSATAINVTAKWTCKPGTTDGLDELTYWWQKVGTEAHSLEPGLLRIEAYRAVGEDALIIHETFADTKVLKFHLMKGTAKMYKKDIDRVAVPERYFFRGKVSWLIRTYSKILRLPATYTTLSSQHTVAGGSMSDGTI
jgi:quinol monooxygenase YgiN